MSYVKKVKKLGKDICSEGSVIRGRTARTAIKSIRENDCGGSGGGEDMLQARVDATNSCAYLFYNYNGNNVDYIANLDTINVTDMANMFYYCRNITTIPQLDTSNVTNMASMFSNCNALTTIPQLDTSSLNDRYTISTEGMFRNCSSLTTIPLLNFSSLTKVSNLFYGCTSLTNVPALDFSNVTQFYNIFNGCTSLKSILMYGMKVNFNISASTQFETEDLVTILNNLATITTTQTLTMGSTNLAKLSDEQKAIAINKGWTLA